MTTTHPPTIAVVDGVWWGHVPSFHAHHVRVLLEAGCRVISVTPMPADVERQFLSASRGTLFTAHIPPASFGGAQHTPPPWRTMSPKAWARWSGAARAGRVVQRWRDIAQRLDGAQRETGWRIDRAWFAYMDMDLFAPGVFSPLVDAVFRYPWSGMVVSPTHLRRPTRLSAWAAAIRDGDEVFRARACRGVAVLDEGVAGKLRERIGMEVTVLPDVATVGTPGTEPPLVARLRTHARGRPLVLLAGELSARKGILNLIKVANADVAAELAYAVVGPLDEKTAPEEQRASIRAAVDACPALHVELGRFPDEVITAAVAAADVLFAAYVNAPHSSNVVSKAAMLGRPALVATGGLMEERVTRLGTGAAVHPGDHVATARALKALARGLRPDGARLAANYAEYATEHGLPRLRERLLALLGVAVGATPPRA